jgi:hypothetical protein
VVYLPKIDIAMLTENLFASLASIVVPKDYLNDFEIVSVEEKPSEWVITLHEKADRIPAALMGKSSVLDGFCNPITILSHGFSMKKIYLQLYRRRWKEPVSNRHYHNEYDLHPEGMKTTRKFAAFLKAIGR